MENTTPRSIMNSYRFSLILLGAIAVGSVLGLVLGPQATVLKPLGDLFINAMFTLVVPLVLITISASVSSMSDMKRLGRILGNLFFVFIGTGIIAALLILVVVHFYPPAQGVILPMGPVEALQPFSTGEQIVAALTVTDFPELISRKNMLPLILFSIVFGICVNLIGEKGRIIAKGLDALSTAFLKMVSLLMYYAPVGLGAYFASLTGEFGKELLGSYARSMAIYYPLCFIYFLTAFPVYAWLAGGREGVRSLRHVVTPAVTALATQSSLATLPVNLEASARIGVPQDIREIVLPIGATAHMDGTVFSTVLKIAFLFGIYQIPFEGVGVYASALFLSLVGGVVMSGVPGGGLIGEMLIVTLYGFPPEAFPIIATIGYLVDPPATMINAAGDTVAAMMVTRLVEGRDWMKKHLS